MRDNLLRDKSFAFAVRMVRLQQHLAAEKREYVLSKQLVRCGTGVGAMVRESEHAESKADFIHKLAIAQKEINEALYWLELLEATDYLSQAEAQSLQLNATELLKLLTSSLKTSKANLNRQPPEKINH